MTLWHIVWLDIVKRISTEMEYPGQIKVVVIRETRAVITQNNQKTGPAELFAGLDHWWHAFLPLLSCCIRCLESKNIV